MRGRFPAIAILGIVLSIGLVAGCSRYSSPPPPEPSEVRVAHFNDSTPLHEAVFVAQPINVTLNFEVQLTERSTVSVTGEDGQEWTEGPALIEDVSTALKRVLRQGMPDGEYSVRYTACFLDGTCDEGRFSFSIESADLASYLDLRGSAAEEVDMRSLQYAPNRIIISPGTAVTWTNNDSVVHFVNTETHPEHTYFPEQNSLQLFPGDTWTVTFRIPGQYDYHCSAHYPENMVGSIVVAP